MPTELTRYDAACRALAEAVAIDEVKDIRDQAMAMACYARQAKNRDLEAAAVELRMRATRRLDEMRQAQKQKVGLAKGGGGKHGRKRVAEKPTLKDAGIDKNLAHQARQLGALSEQEFEQKVAETRDVTKGGKPPARRTGERKSAEIKAAYESGRLLGIFERASEATQRDFIRSLPAEMLAERDDVDAGSEDEAEGLRIRVKELQDENCRLTGVIAGLEREIEELRAKLATASGDPVSVSAFDAAIKPYEDLVETQKNIIRDLQNENVSLKAAAPPTDPRDCGPLPASLDRTRQGLAS